MASSDRTERTEVRRAEQDIGEDSKGADDEEASRSCSEYDRIKSECWRESDGEYYIGLCDTTGKGTEEDHQQHQPRREA